jgi:hypothetical protein
MGRERDKNGRFVKGNEIGKETRAKVGDKLASKYREEYGEQMLEWFLDETRPYPQFVFFAQEIGVDSDTLENWCKEYPHFRCCYNECKKIQLGKLVEGTMFRQFDSSFAKFIAINCHGMKEKTETDVKADATITVNIKEVD